MNIVRESGTVVRVEGARAAVTLDPHDTKACRGCAACKPMGENRLGLWVDAGDLETGDRVTVEVPLPSPWRAILLVFGLPLVALVVGVMAGGHWEWFQDVTGLGAEAAGLALGGVLGAGCFAVAVFEERRFADRHQPRVLSAEEV
jgi:positive regulator of sigma E activity